MAKASTDSKAIAIDDNYDVVVVGCGMAGLTAGLAAAENGADVVILEKAPKELRGGQTQYTAGIRIATADVDLDLDFAAPNYTKTDFRRHITRATNGKADSELLDTMIGNSAETFEWLTDHLRDTGFEWTTTPSRRDNVQEGKAWHDPDELVSSLIKSNEKHGTDVVYEAEARRLLRGRSDRVTGVEAVVSGDRIAYHSDAVVIACGGFESNKEKRAKYFGRHYEEMIVRGVRYNTGEAIDMALDAGAKAEGQWSGAHMTINDAGAPKVEGGQTRVGGYQYGIVLNHEGERFLDEGEDIRSITYAKFGRYIFEQSYQEAFVIQDSETNQYVSRTGPTEPVRAESIEELVSRLGIEEEARAVETFTEYNAACDPDADLDPEELDGNSTTGISPPKSNWAKPLDSLPLVGYPVTGAITFTFGGVAQSPDAEVLDTSDNPIPGLYAAGNSTGGLFYDSYAGGTGLANASIFGKIAGEEAAEYVGG